MPAWIQAISAVMASTPAEIHTSFRRASNANPATNRAGAKLAR